MQNQQIINATSETTQPPTLASFGLQVQETMTTPSRPRKKSRPVWIVSGNVFGLETFFRDIKGRKFRGSWSFFKDQSCDILDYLKSNERLSYAEQIEASLERKLAKATRYESYAINAEKRAEIRQKNASAISSMIPLGQPILIGHHSERRHRKDMERIDNNMRKSVEESKKAEYFLDKSDTLTYATKKLESRRFVGNRIKDAQKEVAQLSKRTQPNNPRLLQAQEKLKYWQNRLVAIEAKQIAEGCQIPSPETLKIGDLVYYIGKWYPVAKVNRKTVTVSYWSNTPTSYCKIEYTRILKFQSKPLT